MDPVWQRLWLRCQQHDWQSLAFIGSSKRDPDGVLEIAHGMARLASELGQELTVFDARNLGLKDMGRMLAQVQSITSRGKRCIVVLKLVTENATTVPTHAADAASGRPPTRTAAYQSITATVTALSDSTTE